MIQKTLKAKGEAYLYLEITQFELDLIEIEHRNNFFLKSTKKWEFIKLNLSWQLHNSSDVNNVDNYQLKDLQTSYFSRLASFGPLRTSDCTGLRRARVRLHGLPDFWVLIIFDFPILMNVLRLELFLLSDLRDGDAFFGEGSFTQRIEFFPWLGFFSACATHQSPLHWHINIKLMRNVPPRKVRP